MRTGPVCVSGMGCITAAGRTLAHSLATLDQGWRMPRPPQLFATECACPVFACDLPDLLSTPDDDIAALPGARLLPGLSRSVYLAVCAATQALADAGLSQDILASRRVGVCLGTSVGASLNFFDSYRTWLEHKSFPLDELYSYLASNPALALARIMGARGPAQTITNACSSGADAIGMAAQWIRDDLCDIVLAGGTDALSRITYLGFNSLRLLSPEPCTPFDKNRKGLNIGEGSGIMVLESRSSLHASGRDATGFVLGYGTCSDAYHLTAPHPEGLGLAAALDQALTQAGLATADIAFINAHGTATPTNDAAEGNFFRTRFAHTPFIATKGCTGHTLGAAGAIEAILALCHLRAGALPASPGFAEQDPAIGIAPVTAPTPVAGRAALSQSLAFGGNNSILLLGKEAVCR